MFKICNVSLTFYFSCYRNNKTITTTENVDIRFDGQIAILSITNCTSEHHGTYKIIASNSGGTSESIAKVTITGNQELHLMINIIIILINITIVTCK